MRPEQLIPLIVLAVVLPLVILRNRRPRTLRPQWMWVTPLIVMLLIGLGLWGMAQNPNAAHAPFGPDAWAVLAVGGVLGGIAGWYRGKTVTIE